MELPPAPVSWIVATTVPNNSESEDGSIELYEESDPGYKPPVISYPPVLSQSTTLRQEREEVREEEWSIDLYPQPLIKDSRRA